MENKSDTIKGYVAQSILIVFSVVLGLYLSERIEERKRIKESEDLLATIKSEVGDNMKLLEKWHPYHREIGETLDSLVEDEMFVEGFIENKYLIYEKLLTRGTFMGRFPASDAWDIAKSHPRIVNIDHNELLILSKLYGQQEMTFDPGMRVFELLSSKDVNTAEDAKSNLEVISNYISELLGREKQLLHYFKEAVVTLDLKGEGEVDN